MALLQFVNFKTAFLQRGHFQHCFKFLSRKKSVHLMFNFVHLDQISFAPKTLHALSRHHNCFHYFSSGGLFNHLCTDLTLKGNRMHRPL